MNNTVLKTIRTLCIENKNPQFDDYDDVHNVYAAIAHGCYFVRPGENTRKFMEELASALADGIKDATCVLEDDDMFRIHMGYRSLHPVAEHALEVIRKFFDHKFFEEQSQLIANDTMDVDEILTEYLDKLDNDQLFTFQRQIDMLSEVYDLFTSDYTNSIVVFSRVCHDIDSSVPNCMKEPHKWVKFIEDNPRFEFDYLDKEDIVQEINRMITKDRAMAANMARTFYYTRDISFATRYALITHNFERMCMASPFRQYLD